MCVRLYQAWKPLRVFPSAPFDLGEKEEKNGPGDEDEGEGGEAVVAARWVGRAAAEGIEWLGAVAGG